MRVPTRMTLRFPKRLRVPAAGALLGAGLLWLVWLGIDARVRWVAAAESAEGRSPVVAATPTPWAQTVIPLAIAGEGEPAEQARLAAAARIDLVAGRARRGELDPLKRLVPAILTAIDDLDQHPTRRGARWGEWLVPRLLDATTVLDPTDRARLLGLGDQTLRRLASRARRWEAIVRTPEPEPAPPTVVATTPDPLPEPEPPTAPVVESLPPPPAKPATTAAVVARVPTATPPVREPAEWNPDWQPTEPTQPAEEAPSELPRATVPASERELLVEFFQLIEQLPEPSAEPRARGPIAASPDPEADPLTAVRQRLDEVRAELAAVGYRTVSADQVERLTSDDPEVRLRFAEALLSEPAGEAARLLLLLAEDEDAEVRAAAIGALGSSPNRQLVQRALQIATHDADPRVGRLADALRDRLR